MPLWNLISQDADRVVHKHSKFKQFCYLRDFCIRVFLCDFLHRFEIGKAQLEKCDINPFCAPIRIQEYLD